MSSQLLSFLSDPICLHWLVSWLLHLPASVLKFKKFRNLASIEWNIRIFFEENIYQIVPIFFWQLHDILVGGTDMPFCIGQGISCGTFVECFLDDFKSNFTHFFARYLIHIQLIFMLSWPYNRLFGCCYDVINHNIVF